MKESDIVYEQGEYWVCQARKGFEVYRTGVTHSIRCAVIGYSGQEGFTRAIAEIDRRIGAQKPSPGPSAVCWEMQADKLPIRLSFSIKVF